MPNGSTDDGCRDDEQTKLDDQGFYTYVVGTEAQRGQAETIPEVTFVPLSAEHGPGRPLPPVAKPAAQP